MSQAEDLYLLSFDTVSQIIDIGLQQLPPALRHWVDKNEYVLYILECLSVKICDHDAVSAIDLGVAYLKRFHVPEDFARAMSHHVMDEILNLMIVTFPRMTFRELSNARYILDEGDTLKVYVKRPLYEEARY